MIQDVSKGLGITVLIPETYITEENLFATIGFWDFFHVACTCLLGWTKSPTRRTRLIDRLVTPNVTEYTDNCCSAYLALMLSVALPCLILVAQISEFIDCVRAAMQHILQVQGVHPHSIHKALPIFGEHHYDAQ